MIDKLGITPAQLDRLRAEHELSCGVTYRRRQRAMPSQSTRIDTIALALITLVVAMLAVLGWLHS